MNQALLNGLVMVAVPESATRDDMLASLVHPLPMMSLVAPVGLFVETRDTALIGRHAYEAWRDLGSPSMYGRARDRVREILAGPVVDPLPDAVEAELARVLAAADADLG